MVACAFRNQCYLIGWEMRLMIHFRVATAQLYQWIRVLELPYSISMDSGRAGLRVYLTLTGCMEVTHGACSEDPTHLVDTLSCRIHGSYTSFYSYRFIHVISETLGAKPLYRDHGGWLRHPISREQVLAQVRSPHRTMTSHLVGF